MSIRVRWDASLVLWILATVTTCFIESLDILNTIFLSSLISNPLDQVDFMFFFYISPLKSLNLVLIPGAKLDGHWGTWTGCIKDYYNLYLKHYVLLLADVFEKLSNRCLENHNLFPSHYFSAPALILDAMLIITSLAVSYFRHWNVLDFLKRNKRRCFLYF